MGALSSVVSLKEKVNRVMYKGLVKGFKGRATRLSYAPPLPVALNRRVDPAEARPSSLDLFLVERREMLSCFGLEAELVTLDDEAGGARGDNGLGNLLYLVEGEPELLSLLLEERRRKLRAFLEDSLGLLGHGTKLGFNDELSEFPWVLGGFVSEANKRIGHA
jgi:hypothetical protein